MRSRAIQARALLRLASSNHTASTATVPASLAGNGLRRKSISRPRPYISACTPPSKPVKAANVVASSSSDSSNKSDSTPSSSSASSSSSGNDSSSSGGSSAPSTLTNKKSDAVDKAKAPSKLASRTRKAFKGVKSANPPPSTSSSVAYESFFAHDRPLLQHEMLPPRSKDSNSALFAPASIPKQGSAGSLTAFFTGDGSLAAFGAMNPFEEQAQWRRRMGKIEPERFNELIDGLAGLEESTEGSGGIKYLMSSWLPKSVRVAVESAKLEEEERMKEEEEAAVQSAIERGEDTEVARKLGIEADLIILGEPHGPSPDWSRGVATYLAEYGRAYEAPPAPQSEEVAAADDGAPRAVSTVFLTDDDPNLMLSHAMVQTTLPLALKWDRLVAQMDAVALGEPDKAQQGVDLTKLNADISEVKDGEEVNMDSVRRKRRKKIRKHKYKKLRKDQRAERQRMKK